jgi:hypothetical protein
MRPRLAERTISTPAGREQIGEYLHFFRSPKATDNVLIFGHAGWVPSLGTTFDVPAGVKLHFRKFHGQANLSNPLQQIQEPYPNTKGFGESLARIGTASNKTAQMLVDAITKRDYVAGDTCFNYVVIKGLGKHWDAQNPNDTSYTVIARELGDAAYLGQASHFVSIRNRRFHGARHYMLLEDVILAVQAHLQGQNNLQFVMAGCRGVHPDWVPH